MDLFQAEPSKEKRESQSGSESSCRDFFDASDQSYAPLASRIRPRTLDEFVGQEHLLAEGKLLRRTILADRLSSLILYGPPGSGKTTLAYIISRMTGARFKSLNAVTANVGDLRKMIEQAQYDQREKNVRTILFIDEIHRFNKAQQDVLMHDVENGTLVLIGSTTHNPSFSVNGPLLSRSTIFELQPLGEQEIFRILKEASEDRERGFGKFRIHFEEGALEHLAKNAS